MIRTLAVTRDHQAVIGLPLEALNIEDYAWVWVDFVAPVPEESALLESYFQFHPLAVEEAWKRVCDQAQKGKITENGTTFAAYTVMDKLVDQYFPSLFAIEDELADIESQSAEESLESLMQQVFQLRSKLLKLRRTIVPMRDLLYRVVNSQHVQRHGHQAYFLDVYDHLLKLTDMIEADREMTSDLRDSYISLNSNRMNNIMKTLTVITTIFMPLTLIAGIYGMNFEKMPELEWPFGYAAVLLLMLLLGGSMVLWFLRRGWFK